MGKKRFRIICILLLSLAIAVTTAGCGREQAAPEETLQEEAPSMEQDLTIEHIVSNSELTEADFADIDFDAFIAMYALTKENIRDYYLPDLMEMYHQKMAQEKTTDYSDIFDQGEGRLSSQDLKQIDVLILEYLEGNSNHYLIVDFPEGKAYRSQMNIVSACGESNKVADLTVEDRVAVLATLESSKIWDWETAYIGTNEDTTGSLGWAVGFRLKDGSSVFYHGSGVRNSGTPTAFFDLKDTLFDRFPQ